jgi:hypothetical protein
MAPSATRPPVGPSEGVRVPLLGIHVTKPDRGSIGWYLGLGVMTAIELIEWPVAILVGVSHALATNTRNPDIREAAKGAQAST